jgi:hypothetical protein
MTFDFRDGALGRVVRKVGFRNIRLNDMLRSLPTRLYRRGAGARDAATCGSPRVDVKAANTPEWDKFRHI